MSRMKVISTAAKLLFEVPEGKTVVFPADAAISSYGINNENPVVVVHNATDVGGNNETPNGTWQGAGPGDFIIINEVPEVVANEALRLFSETDGDIEALRQAIEYLIQQGYTDQYTTDHKYWDTNVSVVGSNHKRSGLMARNPTPYEIWIGTDSQIHIQVDEVRHIESDILLRTYTMPDGSEIDLSSIPRHLK